MEKLYELVSNGDYDVIVVDTPPTRNALELLEAPSRLTRFLENRIFRALLLPTRAYFRAVGVATQAVLRTISKVAGTEIVNDTVAFFRAFQGMEEGFRLRASSVRGLLADPATAYVLVTSPREDAVAEASFFAGKLEGSGIHPAGVVVNRVQPSFAGAGNLSSPGPPVGGEGDALAALVENLRQLNEVAAREEQMFGRLTDRIGGAAVVRVPLLDADVHDLPGLDRVASHLFDVG